MISCGEFSEILEKAALRVRPELIKGTKEVVEAVAIEAQSYLGHYQAGWKSLAASTLADKAAKGLPSPSPLLRTGHMQATIESRAEADGTGAMGVVGSNNLIAKYQELGTSKMPPRPFLSLAMSRAGPVIEMVFGTVAARILGKAP